MRELLILTTFIFVVVSSQARALDCSPLEPAQPTDQTTEVTGEINAKVSGVLGRIAGADADLDGAYREVSENILSEFPNADKLFIWSRIIFLRCEFINASNQSDTEKNRQLEKLEDRFFSGPPSEDESVLPCEANDGSCFSKWIASAENSLSKRHAGDVSYCNSLVDVAKKSRCLFNAERSLGNRLTACSSSKELIQAMFDPRECLKNGIIEGPECDARLDALRTATLSALQSCDRDIAKRFLEAEFRL